MQLDPPHLTVAIFCDRPEIETFARMHEVALGSGCLPRNTLKVAPADQNFELLSDLGTASEVINLNEIQYKQAVSGHAPAKRAIKAVLAHPKFGKVIVEYLQTFGPGAHPIGISMGAGILGLPEEFWSSQQRLAAYERADWSKNLLKESTSCCNALYGAVGVEISLPTPSQLTTSKPRIPTEVFVSRQLMGKTETLERKMRREYSGGEVIDWSHGVFFSGWAPYTSRRTSVTDAGLLNESVAGLLGSVFAP